MSKAAFWEVFYAQVEVATTASTAADEAVVLPFFTGNITVTNSHRLR